MENTQRTGGFAGDPAAALTVVDGGGCCGGQARTPTAERAAQPDPCCGTAAEATASGSCCGTAAKAEAVAGGSGCCG